MKILVHRTDGGTGRYVQGDARRAEMLATRFDPRTLFRSGPIVIGVLNPFTVINPDEVCWVAVETELPLPVSLPEGLDHLRRLEGRGEFEAVLSRQWPLWLKHSRGESGDLLEALVEVVFRGGSSLYLNALGRVTDAALVGGIFRESATTATYAPCGTVFINPRCIVRTRVYHSLSRVVYPNGLWCAEADDV